MQEEEFYVGLDASRASSFCVPGYKDRLTMPKLIVSTGGDEFFLPDDSYYYLSQMEGPTYVNMLPNAEHSCAGHELQLLFTVKAFYLSTFKVSGDCSMCCPSGI